MADLRAVELDELGIPARDRALLEVRREKSPEFVAPGGEELRAVVELERFGAAGCEAAAKTA